MIHEMALAVSREATLGEIGGLIHIHPTLSETIGEAALKAKNEALHILN